jgi:hypothetical protein
MSDRNCDGCGQRKPCVRTKRSTSGETAQCWECCGHGPCATTCEDCRTEPRLSLSEIEARLTPDIYTKAEIARMRPAAPHVSISAHAAEVHRAWLDVILAALRKE